MSCNYYTRTPDGGFENKTISPDRLINTQSLIVSKRVQMMCTPQNPNPRANEASSRMWCLVRCSIHVYHTIYTVQRTHNKHILTDTQARLPALCRVVGGYPRRQKRNNRSGRDHPTEPKVDDNYGPLFRCSVYIYMYI